MGPQNNNTSLLHTVYQHVVSTPSHTAIIEGTKRRVSYRELWLRATAIAAALKDRKVLREDRIALLIPKSADFVAALLGVWMAEAAFIPIDPTYPSARINQILKNADPRLILTSSSLAIDTSETSKLFLDNIDTGTTLSEPPQIDPNSLAYLIYTSGSTGTPKGVMVSHRGIANVLCFQAEQFAISRESRALLYLSIGFDAALSDIGTILITGGTLVIEGDCPLTPQDVLKVFHREEITHCDLPPSFLPLINPKDLPTSFKTVIIGGEAPPVQAVRAWTRYCSVVNCYGPTEATICTSLVHCDSAWTSASIGNPIPNTEYLVLRPDGSEASIGEAGELLITGMGVAIGYRNLPQLTEKRFVTINGKIFYRTADQVKRQLDGTFQFAGRIDRQIKVSGQLVEPEEVERTLERHPSVREAAVIVKKEILGSRTKNTLYGFIAHQTNSNPATVTQLKAFLAISLPRPMVPHVITVLPSLPRTHHGKIDYAKLETMLGAKQPATINGSIVKVSEKGAILLAAIGTVLGCSSPNAALSFLDHGGDSLSALEVSSLLDREGMALEPSMLLQEISLEETASYLENQERMLTSFERTSEVLEVESKLDSELQLLLDEHSGSNPKPMTNVFLTGATGLLGKAVLENLLRRGLNVTCLVRAVDEKEGRSRIESIIRDFSPALKEVHIQIVCGDITSNRLGLTDDTFQSLATTIDTVIHCAAEVSSVGTYEKLKSGNVNGTKNVATFTLTGAAKRLIFASTLSVFVGSDKNTGTCLESDDLSSPRKLYGGYAQSKFVAERIIQRIKAAAKIPVSIIRFGLITAESFTATREKEFLAQLIRGIAKCGAVPHGDAGIDITPVSFAAQTLIEIAIRGENVSGTYHVANKTAVKLRELAEIFNSLGRKTELVTYKEYSERVELVAPEVAAISKLCLCRAGANLKTLRTVDLFQTTGISFDSQRTEALLGPLAVPPSPHVALATLVAGALY